MKINRYSILAVSISLCLSSTAYSGGLSVTVQSASGGGTASTNHALAEDASVMFYNPALMSSVEGTQFNVGLSLISPDATVRNTGSALPGIAGGTPIAGVNSADPFDLAATPSLFYKRDLTHKMAFGLGISVPFGVSSEYDKDSFARYEATESELTVININPALSFKVNDKFSVGAGLNIQAGNAILARSLDSRLLCGGIVGAAAGAATATAACNAGLGGPGTQATDGSSEVDADGIAYGLNAGVAYRPSNKTTISFGYRSEVKHELEGDVDFQHSAALIATLDGVTGGNGAAALAQAGFSDRDAEADLDLPASASLAFASKITPKLTLHGDVTWTDWSSVPEIRVEFPSVTGSAGLDDSVTDLQWDDTVRVGAGVTYQLSGKTKLRAGIAHDPTPTPSANNRTPRAPRSDSIWYSIGMGHTFSKKLSLDASLAYIHSEDTSITYTAPSETLNYLTRGDVELDAFSAAVSLNYRFK